MGEERGILHAPAWVYCNYTQQIIGKVEDSSNFQTYRYLTVDENGQRNIFCKDQPFLFIDDCKPYINIDPFPYCDSPYYGAAVKNLIKYTENKKWETIKNGTANIDLLKIEEELVTLKKAYEVFEGQQKKRRKTYMCILHVLDRWFNESVNETENTYFDDSKLILETLQTITIQLEEIIAKARRELEITPQDLIVHIGNSLSALRIQLEDLNVYKNGWISLDYKGYDRFNKEWNRKHFLQWNEERMNELMETLKTCSELIYRELFFTESKGYVGKYLEDIKWLMAKFTGEIQILIDGKNKDFKSAVDTLRDSLDKLNFDNNKYKEREYINKDSFLICRCGGMIKIMYDSKDGEKSREHILINLLNLLKIAEEDLHKRIFDEISKDAIDLRELLSYTEGFDFIGCILSEAKVEREYNEFYRLSDGKEIINGYGVELNIVIRPRSVIEKQEHYQEAVKGIIDFSVGKGVDLILDRLGEFGEFVSIALTVKDTLLEPTYGNYYSSIGILLERMQGENIISKGIDVVGTVFEDLIAWTEIVNNLTFQTMADYIGEISIELKLGTHDITYIGEYNITGEQVGEVQINADKREYMAVKNSSAGSYTEMVPVIKYFDNRINIDCVVIQDRKKAKVKYSEMKEIDYEE